VSFADVTRPSAADRGIMSLLVAGAKESHHRQVQEQLLRRLKTLEGHKGPQDHHRHHVVVLETKYYVAEVAVHVMELVEEDSHLPGIDAVDAAVVTFEGGDSEWETRFESLMQKIPKTALESADCAICVVTCEDSGLHRSFNEEMVVSRLLEHNCELVTLDMSAAEVIEEESNALLNGETHATGMARVMEALYSTMWSSMKMKEGAGVPPIDNDQMDAAANGKMEEDDVKKYERNKPEKQLRSKPDTNEEEFDVGKMIDQVRELRMKQGELSDDSRREAAAALAIRFADMLDLDE